MYPACIPISATQIHMAIDNPMHANPCIFLLSMQCCCMGQPSPERGGATSSARAADMCRCGSLAQHAPSDESHTSPPVRAGAQRQRQGGRAVPVALRNPRAHTQRAWRRGSSRRHSYQTSCPRKGEWTLVRTRQHTHGLLYMQYTPVHAHLYLVPVSAWYLHFHLPAGVQTGPEPQAVCSCHVSCLLSRWSATHGRAT